MKPAEYPTLEKPHPVSKENPHFNAREGKQAAAAKASSEASLVSTGSSSQI